jgi:nitrogen fixation NifU-like protein
MEQLYAEIILDHSRAPHHAGLREPFDAQAHQVNPTCGDEITLRLLLSGPQDGALAAGGGSGSGGSGSGGSDSGGSGSGGSGGDGDTAAGAVVRDVSYQALGCSISQASASVLTDLVIGRPLPEALRLMAAFDAMVTSKGADPGDEDLLGDGVAFAGVARYPNRVKCALLGWMAFKQAAVQLVGAETVRQGE